MSCDRKEVKDSILLLLKQQIQSIADIKVDLLPSIKELLIYDISLGELFTLYNLLRDYDSFLKNDLHQFAHFYSLDSSSSGLQIMAILTKSKNLSQSVNLSLTDDKKEHIYSDCVNHIKNTIGSFFNILNEMDKYWILECKHLFLKIKRNDFSFVNVNNLLAKSKELSSLFGLIDNNITKTCFTFLNEHKYLLNKKILKKINSTYNTQNALIVVNVLILVEIQYFQTCFEKTNFVAHLTRALFKKPIMTMVYASTSYGRQRQMLETIIEIYLVKGQLFSKNNLFFIKQVILTLDKLLYIWIIHKYPESLDLLHSVENYCKTNLKIPLIIFSPYFQYCQKPLLKTRLSIRLHNRIDKLWIYTDQIDRIGLKTSLVANFIQFCDANIVHLFGKQIYKYLAPEFASKIHFFTVHDCFYITPVLSVFLKAFLLEAYKDFYDLGLENQLIPYPILFNGITKYQQNNPENLLTREDINHPDFVKH
jgi:hypothetical protein